MSNELRYTQYTYDAGITKATEELRKQLALKTEQLRIATDAIHKRQWDSMHKYETCLCGLCRATVEIQRLEKEQ